MYSGANDIFEESIIKFGSKSLNIYSAVRIGGFRRCLERPEWLVALEFVYTNENIVIGFCCTAA
jgi:hypothetical protein